MRVSIRDARESSSHRRRESESAAYSHRAMHDEKQIQNSSTTGPRRLVRAEIFAHAIVAKQRRRARDATERASRLGASRCASRGTSAGQGETLTVTAIGMRYGNFRDPRGTARAEPPRLENRSRGHPRGRVSVLRRTTEASKIRFMIQILHWRARISMRLPAALLIAWARRVGRCFRHLREPRPIASERHGFGSLQGSDRTHGNG